MSKDALTIEFRAFTLAKEINIARTLMYAIVFVSNIHENPIKIEPYVRVNTVCV